MDPVRVRALQSAHTIILSARLRVCQESTLAALNQLHRVSDYLASQERQEIYGPVLATQCAYPGCEEPYGYRCDVDGKDTPFCEEHGSKGGDRSVQDVGLIAYPGVCWKCGGYNADA